MHIQVVELPGKTEKLQGFLGSYWMIMVSYGHVRDLPKDDFQFIPLYFTPTYVPTDFGKKTLVKLAAVANPITVDMQLVKAQEARRVLDRLVDYGMSAPLTNKVGWGASADRVQSPALQLVVEREQSIRDLN